MTEEEFKEKMKNLNSEFSALNAEAAELAKQIELNLKELWGE